MLPHELSTDICSLRPNQDRLVLSCLMQLDAAGNIESFEIVEGVIRSAARMTYTDVHAILEGDAETRARYAPLVPEFERMKKLAVLMNQRREERGSIDFDLPEPVIEFDENGQMRGVTRAERTWANRLIEEFMLAANECVADWLEDLGVPSLYRIHEKPDPRRVVQFEELAASLRLFARPWTAAGASAVQTRGERRESHGQGRNPRQHEVPEDIAVTPRMYQKLAARIEGKPEERILSYLMLRSLSQARYSEVNEGHFALAAPTYTHFTSPIRRYPDLIVHRIAKALLRAGVPGQSNRRRKSASALPGRTPMRARRKSGCPRSLRCTLLWDPGKGSSEPSIDPPSPSPNSPRSPKKPATPSAAPPKPSASWSSGKKSASCRTASARNSPPSSSTPPNTASSSSSPISSSRASSPSTLCAPTATPGARTRTKSSASAQAAASAPAIASQVILDRVLAQERKLQFALVEEELPLTGKKAASAAIKIEEEQAQKHIAAAPGWEQAAIQKGQKR